MIFYYLLIAIAIVMDIFAIYNLYSSTKIEKNIDNYLFILTSSKAYFLGATFFSLAILIIITFQAMQFIFDIRVFSIIFFFASLFFLSLSHLIYYLSAKRKLKDYKEFFKEFEIDLSNKCEKLMLKHIASKEKNKEKIKDIFKRNRHLCKN